MKETLDLIKELLKGEEIADFRTFVESPKYCGNPDLYEYWYVQENGIPLNCQELLLDGSLGGGKSTFADYYLAYRIYLLFVNGSPQKQLGLSANSDIYCLYFSVSMTIAKKSGFSLLYDIFKTCKWFKENAPINTELKSSIEFIDKHFYIDFASSEGHQISLNVYAFILDEANFRSGVGNGTAEQYEEVTLLYQQLLDRQVSRFSKADGSVDALAILVSSASYQSSFLEKRKKIAKEDKYSYVITTAAYDVKPERFSSEKFEVFIGSGSVAPQVIENEAQKKNILRSANIMGTGEEDKFFVHPPINLLKQFRTNTALALQNHSGIPTMIKTSFLSNLTYLHNSYVSSDVIKPILESFTLEASTEDDTQLIEYLVKENIEFEERPHSLFLDLSVQSDPGSLCCFRYDGLDERNYDVHTRVFSLTIQPPDFPAQTNITKVQQFIIELAEYLNIVCFGSDQYQSTQLRQNVREALNLPDIRVSIDSSDIPHLNWQRALVEGRIKQTEDQLLEDEVKEAIHDHAKHRVLKAKGSLDDVMQANVGAFFLSDTYGKNAGSLDDIYNDSDGRINLVGGRSQEKVLRDLGFRS